MSRSSTDPSRPLHNSSDPVGSLSLAEATQITSAFEDEAPGAVALVSFTGMLSAVGRDVPIAPPRDGEGHHSTFDRGEEVTANGRE